MIRNTLQSSAHVIRCFYCAQSVTGAPFNFHFNNNICEGQLNPQKYPSLLYTPRFYFLKSDVTIDYKKNYYEILKVNEKSTLMEIKKSFYKLAKESHPDTSKGNQDLFKQINEAYNVLSHQQRRKIYDMNRYRPTQQNPNDFKAQQQRSRSSPNSEGNSFDEQAYKQSQQYQQRQQEAYYHYSQGQWQQFRSGYKYHINPQSDYYANLTNNLSGEKMYSNLKKKFQKKTESQAKFLNEMEMYFEYLEKIRNKKRKDIEEYHRKMEELEKQLYEEKKQKLLKTFVGRSYLKVTNVMEKISDKLQSYLTKENEKQK